MNNAALGTTNGTFCFIGNGGGAFAGIVATLNIGTTGLTIPNNLWTNRDGAGSLQTPTATSNERFIGFSGTSGTGTFSGQVQINGGAVFRATPTGTLVMSGVLQNGTETFANGGRNDVFIDGPGTIVFSGNNTYTGFTQMNAGTLVIAHGGAQNLLLTGTGSVNGPGGVDLRGGRVVFDYAATGSDPLAQILPLLQTSLGNNFATGQLRVGNATPGIGIAYVDDTTGQRLQLLRTYLGDSNLDGKVNALDFNTLANNFGGTAKQWIDGDFNYDGTVNSLDFDRVAANYNQSLPAAPAPVLGTLVPEPTSVWILSLGAVCMRRRRKC
jgi:autotransporter-associated beta strand protein